MRATTSPQIWRFHPSAMPPLPPTSPPLPTEMQILRLHSPWAPGGSIALIATDANVVVQSVQFNVKAMTAKRSAAEAPLNAARDASEMHVRWNVVVKRIVAVGVKGAIVRRAVERSPSANSLALETIVASLAGEAPSVISTVRVETAKPSAGGPTAANSDAAVTIAYLIVVI